MRYIMGMTAIAEWHYGHFWRMGQQRGDKAGPIVGWGKKSH